jgi:prepilin-type N-terminal cleavage/methylation domain-containing protein
MKHRERGFTLLEVMLALAVSSMVLLLSGELFGTVVDARGRIRTSTALSDREFNQLEWLREAFRSLDVGSNDRGSFQGGPDQVEFSSFLLTNRGWSESKRIRLLVAGAQRLMAIVGEADTLALGERMVSLNLDYLLQPGAQARWVQEWRSPSTAPLAVRLRITRRGKDTPVGTVDTLLFLVGARG